MGWLKKRSTPGLLLLLSFFLHQRKLRIKEALFVRLFFRCPRYYWVAVSPKTVYIHICLCLCFCFCFCPERHGRTLLLTVTIHYTSSPRLTAQRLPERRLDNVRLIPIRLLSFPAGMLKTPTPPLGFAQYTGYLTRLSFGPYIYIYILFVFWEIDLR